MKTRMLAVVFALFFIIGTAGAGFAAYEKCTVESVDGETVTLKCDADHKMKEGDKVKVKASKGAAVEGC